ncbi:unnamed protein product, partial [Medioppia subpectinata]
MPLKEYNLRYYNSWLESNHLFIQMEFCSQSLKSVLKYKPIVFERQPEEEMKVFEYFICCEVFKELLECVQYLHSCDPPVIHRDLKPDNILLEHNIRFNRFVKLCDFGLATDHVMASMSHSAGVGTSQYMAIEAHQRRYTTKADVYSLGVIAQHLFDLFNILMPTTGRPVIKCWTTIIIGLLINILFVTTNTRVYGLGSNSEGVLGLGHNRPIHTPEEVIKGDQLSSIWIYFEQSTLKIYYSMKTKDK